MEKLIVIEGKEKYQYKDLKSLVKGFINSNYYNMDERDKRERNRKNKKLLSLLKRNFLF